MNDLMSPQRQNLLTISKELKVNYTLIRYHLELPTQIILKLYTETTQAPLVHHISK